MEDPVLQHFTQARALLDAVIADPNFVAHVRRAGAMMSDAILRGNKILACGNGGSMCDAMHFAEELTGRYRADRRALPAIAISDPSHIACVANDYGYEHVFSRYIEGVGQDGDVLLAISTSGNSANVIRAAQAARDRGLQVVALTGNSGGALAKLADVEIRVTHHGFADRIQEVHIKVIHSLIDYIERHTG
jgi:D-sedoheptulose 7-phosphate isomerase